MKFNEAIGRNRPAKITRGKAYDDVLAPIVYRFQHVPFELRRVFNDITSRHKAARDAKHRFYWNDEYKFWFTKSSESAQEAKRELERYGVMFESVNEAVDDNTTQYHVEIMGSVTFDTDEPATEFIDDIRFGKVRFANTDVEPADITLRAISSHKIRHTYHVTIKGIISVPEGTTAEEVRQYAWKEHPFTLVGLPIHIKSFDIQPMLSKKAEPWE